MDESLDSGSLKSLIASVEIREKFLEIMFSICAHLSLLILLSLITDVFLEPMPRPLGLLENATCGL